MGCQPGAGMVVFMLLTLPPPTMLKRNNLERIAHRAEAAGYRYGEHADRDKQRGRTKFENSTLATQNQSLDVYLVWCSKAYGVRLEECATKYPVISR
ncbi:hypothetical protein FOBRF1_006804 [Fusarium oxysporum]